MLGKTLILYAMLLVSACLLSACGGINQGVKTGIVFEPEAKNVEPPLTQEEVAALQSEGEIDRNLSSTAMADVTKQYKFYLHKGKKNIKASIKQCEKYLPYTREIFANKGMPKDLAYLAIVESGYRTKAKSPVGAAGAWQFMKRTGTAFGLDQDSWTDDRLDVYEATEAAATYLSKLFQEFRDWPTAIAAYNAGEGKMRRAMAASGGKNFFEVRDRNETLDDKLKLREETKQYVPRFLAVVKIMRNLKTLNFPTMNEEKAYQVERLVAQPGTDLKQISKSISVKWGDFCDLNSHHQSPITSASRETYVYVPKEKVAKAVHALANKPQGEYAGWKTCTLTHGETWQKLAKRYNVPEDRLQAVNPGCSLQTGAIVYLPGNAATAMVAKTSIDHLKKGTNKDRVHTVQSRETLYAVAHKYGVSPIALMKYNQIGDPAKLHPGTKLRIPEGKAEIAKSPAQGSSYGSLGSRKNTGQSGTHYVVQSNDTYWKISRKFNVTVEQLKAWNRSGDQLRVGETLRVSCD